MTWDDIKSEGNNLTSSEWNNHVTDQKSRTGVTTQISNVVEDTTPQLGGDLDMNDKPFTQEFTAGQGFTTGDLGYLKSDGKIWYTDADAEATSKGLIVMATETINADAIGTFIVMGKYTFGSPILIAGATYYLSTSAAGADNVAPSATGDQIRIIGYALSTTVLFFKPDETYIEAP